MSEPLRVLVTGAGGFVGSHTVEHLVARGAEVTGIDGFDDYYDVRRKAVNRAALEGLKGFHFVDGDLRDRAVCERALEGVHVVVHAAARPGVRASIEDPLRTYSMNVTATVTLLEAMRARGVSRMVFTSTSSVYGGDAPLPFREEAPSSRPLSPYAASKRACELLIASYAELHGLGAHILRLFTVYGPRGRPDMSVGKFIEAAYAGRPVPLHGDGSIERDFTFVSDIARGLTASAERVRPGQFAIANLGGSERSSMRQLIALIEKATGRKLIVERKPPAPGDAPVTWADVTRARELLDWVPKVRLEEGVTLAAEWTRRMREEHPTVYG